MKEFLTTKFPQFSKNKLHIAGESYGGRWAPKFMHKLVQLADLKSQRSISNPLGSIILVNAAVGSLAGEFSTSHYDFGCTPSGVAVKLGLGYNASICSTIQEFAPNCDKYGTLCDNMDDVNICKFAWQFCDEKITSIVPLNSRNPYNGE